MSRTFFHAILIVLVAGACSKQDAADSYLAPPAQPSVSATKPAPPKIEKAYVLGKVGTLFLSFPEAWKDSVKHSVQLDRTYDAVQFEPPTGGDFACLVEIVNLGEANVSAADPKSVLLMAGRTELPHSVETNLTILEFKGQNVTAAYFRVTDWRWTNSPPPTNEFKYLTQGYAKLSPLVLTFRLVANDTNIEPAVLDVIKSARLAKP